MLDLTAADYAGFAESRLTRARRRFDLTASQSYAERRGELAQIASLVWDATIDMVSALALLIGVALTGRSSDMTDYAKRRLPDAYVDWPGPARLHNFQHKPDHPEPGVSAGLPARRQCVVTDQSAVAGAPATGVGMLGMAGHALGVQDNSGRAPLMGYHLLAEQDFERITA